MTRPALWSSDRPSMRRARRQDRRVYLGSHPLLFAALAATRRHPTLRLGRTVLVHGTDAFRQALTGIPLDRAAAGTTGGAARAALAGSQPVEAPAGGLLFDQDGPGHRDARRGLAEDVSTAGVARLRPVWREVLEPRLAPLADGGTVDLVEVAREMAGATVCALLRVAADPLTVATAASDAAAAAVRAELPGPRRRAKIAAGTAQAAARLLRLLGGSGEGAAGSEALARRTMLAVAAVTTTVAALPRAAAWCTHAALWDDAADPALRPTLVRELLRVTAPSPLLPRIAAADGNIAGRLVRSGDRLVLVARHAAHAHTAAPDCRAPADSAVAQLVFGAGPHACPGALLARAQLADVLAALAAHRPIVVRARVDRRAALPGWRSLTLQGRRG